MKRLSLLILLAAAAFGQTTNYPAALDTDASLFVAGDNVQSTLSTAMGTGDTAVVFAACSPTTACGFAVNMIATICDTTTTIGTGSNRTTKCTAWEHMKVTAVNGNVLTVTRAYAGTSARSHASGALVSALIDSAHQKVLKDATIALETGIGKNFGNMAKGVSIEKYGAACDDVTDDTTALRNAISDAWNQGGGIVYIPASSNGCLISGQITIPVDSTSPVPAQKTIRLLGYGASSTGLTGAQPPSAGSTLDLRYSGTGGKITTLGSGMLEIGWLNLRDGSVANTTPFVYDTNTVLMFHDNSVWGSVAGSTTTQDVIVLGGTTTTRDGTLSAPFGGYGTVIERNMFDKARRAVYGRVYANGVVVQNNTIGQNGGGAAAIEFYGDDALATGFRSDGGVIANNIIELPGYTAAIKLDWTNKFSLTNNNCYDYDGSSVYCVRLGAHAQYTTTIAGTATSGGPPYYSDAGGTNTVFGSTDQSATPVISKLNAIQINNNFYAYSSLPATATKGMSLWCTNCAYTSPCTSGGSGAMATGDGTNWNCPNPNGEYFNAGGTQQAGAWTVFGKCTLGTNCAVTFTKAWSSGTSYQCTGTDQTAAAAVKVVNTSASVATFTGTGTDVISYVCVGN